jgi:hypothetical protein
MARVDVMHKQMAVAMAAEYEEDVGGMGPGDDYYMAPYAVVPVLRRRSKHCPNPESALWLLYAGYKCRDSHDRAIQAMGLEGAVVRGGSVHDVEEGLLGAKVKATKWTRVRQNAWAGGDDVCLKLEEKLAEAACAALGATLDADWRAQRAAAVEALCDEMGGAAGAAAHAAPLASLPEWGDVPFAPLSPTEARAQEAASRERVRLEEADRQRCFEETKRAADEARKAKYEPTLARFQGGVPLPDDGLCVYVFDAPDHRPEGVAPGEWRCQYDRKPDEPFCTQCRAMLDLLKAGPAGEKGPKRARTE